MAAKRHDPSVENEIYLEHLPDNLLLDPLDYIFADHCRQAGMCAALKGLVVTDPSSPTAPETAAAILHCLYTDLPNHIRDEEHDLFPSLRAKSAPSDRVADILALINREHTRDRELTAPVLLGLQQISDGETLTDPDGFHGAAAMLSEMHLSHLNWENAVLLPLARRILQDEDLEAIGRAMAKRRKIAYPDSG